MREALQLTFKVVRDKSIKEAMVFTVYFAIFLLIAFEVSRPHVIAQSCPFWTHVPKCVCMLFVILYEIACAACVFCRHSALALASQPVQLWNGEIASASNLTLNGWFSSNDIGE